MFISPDGVITQYLMKVFAPDSIKWALIDASGTVGSTFERLAWYFHDDKTGSTRPTPWALCGSVEATVIILGFVLAFWGPESADLVHPARR